MSLRFGFDSVRHFATNWLLNVLHACYTSAETIYKTNERTSSREFCAANRLLGVEERNRSTNANQNENPLTAEEKLLAKGHSKLQLVPLLTFCLIQCDALRINEKGEGTMSSFDPSIDAKCAAAVNMSNMSASALSRCIAPRIEIWMNRSCS